MSRSVSANNIFNACWEKDDALEFTVISGLLICIGTVQQCRDYIETHPGRWFGCSAYAEFSPDDWYSYALPDYMAPMPEVIEPVLPTREPIRKLGYLLGWKQTHHRKPERAKGAVSIRRLSELED